MYLYILFYMLFIYVHISVPSCKVRHEVIFLPIGCRAAQIWFWWRVWIVERARKCRVESPPKNQSRFLLAVCRIFTFLVVVIPLKPGWGWCKNSEASLSVCIRRSTVWLSTAPTEPLTRWYQVRCLLQTPLFAKLGQTLSGTVLLAANGR